MSVIATEAISPRTVAEPIHGAWHRRGQMQLLMLGADLAGFAAAASLIFSLNHFLKLFILNEEDIKYLVVPVLCLVLFANSRLYPGVGINPAEEIKLVTQYTTSGFVGGLILLLLVQQRWAPMHFALPLVWVLAIFCVLMMRWSTRIVASKLGLWGEPVVVIGSGKHVERTIGYFRERPRLGYVPVLGAIDTTLMADLERDWPIPVIEFRSLLALDSDRYARDGIQTALVDVPAISEFFRSEQSKDLFRLFRRVILVMDLDWIDGASMRIKDFEGVIGISAEKSVLTTLDAYAKRALDIVLALVAALLASPVMLAAAVWIKHDSPGGVLFSQERLGMGGQVIRVYKFRSMFSNAESALKVYLGSHAEARREWEANQKLCDDPRVTRAGKWLRKFSIDELPQLINVLKGEMSLVGPRPIMPDQVKLYGANMEAYCGVRPGLTGLWQVSGRNRTTFEERARYDTYYIRNWSVWLDMYVMLRTIWVVVNRDGAY